jgi:hypothetical protein
MMQAQERLLQRQQGEIRSRQRALRLREAQEAGR